MAHARTKLTVFGRQLLVTRSSVKAGRSPMSPTSSASAGPPATSGCAAIEPKEGQVWTIDHLGPSSHRDD